MHIHVCRNSKQLNSMLFHVSINRFRIFIFSNYREGEDEWCEQTGDGFPGIRFDGLERLKKDTSVIVSHDEFYAVVITSEEGSPNRETNVPTAYMGLWHKMPNRGKNISERAGHEYGGHAEKSFNVADIECILPQGY